MLDKKFYSYIKARFYGAATRLFVFPIALVASSCGLIYEDSPKCDWVPETFEQYKEGSWPSVAFNFTANTDHVLSQDSWARETCVYIDGKNVGSSTTFEDDPLLGRTTENVVLGQKYHYSFTAVHGDYALLNNTETGGKDIISLPEDYVSELNDDKWDILYNTLDTVFTASDKCHQKITLQSVFARYTVTIKTEIPIGYITIDFKTSLPTSFCQYDGSTSDNLISVGIRGAKNTASFTDSRLVPPEGIATYIDINVYSDDNRLLKTFHNQAVRLQRNTTTNIILEL